MIADAVYLAVAGIDFCHAAGRSIISNRLSVRMRMTSIVPQTWIRQRLGPGDDTVPLRSRILERSQIFQRRPHIAKYVRA